MIRFYNGTPHEINIISNAVYNPNIRKYVITDGSDPQIIVSLPSDGMLSAVIDTATQEPINNIPVYGKTIISCDPLPDGYDIYIVSALYMSAARACGMDTGKLYTVADPVYSADGRTVLGSRGICPAF